MLKDIVSNMLVETSLAPASRTAGAANGTAINLENYGSAAVVFSCGALGGGTATPTIEESANGSTGWTAIAAGRLNGTLAAVGANEELVIGLTDVAGITKSFSRPVITVAGGTGTLCAAYVVKGNPRHAPASASNVGSIYIS